MEWDERGDPGRGGAMAGGIFAGNEVQCPDCGAKLVKKGKKKRILLTRDGREIELDREYAVCPACGQGIFPPG